MLQQGLSQALSRAGLFDRDGMNHCKYIYAIGFLNICMDNIASSSCSTHFLLPICPQASWSQKWLRNRVRRTCRRTCCCGMWTRKLKCLAGNNNIAFRRCSMNSAWGTLFLDMVWLSRFLREAFADSRPQKLENLAQR